MSDDEVRVNKVVNPLTGRKVKAKTPLGKVIRFYRDGVGQPYMRPEVKHRRRKRKNPGRAVALP